VAKQPLWTGGRIEGGINQATVKQKIGTLALLDVQRQLMESTVATYAAILGDRKRLEAAILNVHEHERLQTLITRRASGGIASQADIQLASSRVSQAIAQRLQLEATLLRTQNDLLALTQQAIPAVEQVPSNLTELPATDGIAADVEKISATVQQRLLEVELARTATDLATADMLPTLYVKMEQDMYTSTADGEIPQGNRVGVVLEGNIEGLGLSGWKRVKSSESRVGAAKKNVESARNDVRRQVQGLLTDLNSQQLILQSNELLVQSTEKTLDSFMRQYDAGRKSWVDVLNTQRELSDARLNLEQTRSALLVTKLRLAAQCGQFDLLAGVTAQ
jgi:outer membrane protein, adhesin transport system